MSRGWYFWITSIGTGVAAGFVTTSVMASAAGSGHPVLAGALGGLTVVTAGLLLFCRN